MTRVGAPRAQPGGEGATSAGDRWRDADLPPDVTLVFDASMRRTDGGRAIIGGSPLRILKVSDAGSATLDRWEAGEPVGAGVGRQRLARRLLDGGLAHPRFSPGGFGPADVTRVVIVHDHADLLEPTLDALRRADGSSPGAPGPIIVADDASPDAAAIARVASAHGATVVRRDVNGGPGAIRNAAIARVTTPVVAFLDRNVEPEAGWLEPLLEQLTDPRVALVAPRIRAAAGTGALARYDLDRSPLDLGATAARVAPGSRVSYVPATTIVVRREAFEELDGYDESLRMGEDVDLVWRLIDAGHTVRYEPRSVVRHPPRPDLLGWAQQRFDYGTSAAALDRRHPGAVAPLSMSGWTAASWALAAAGHPVVGATVAAGAAAMLPARLTMLERPWQEAWALAGTGQLAAWRPVASALTRTWWPLTWGAAVVSRRARVAAVAAAIVPPLVDWVEGDRTLDPLRYVGLRILDDLAYGAGVWAGCRRERSWAALRPTLRSWPGRQPAVTTAIGPAATGP